MVDYSRENKKRNHHKKSHLVLKIFLSIILLILVGIGILFYSVYRNAENNISDSYAKMDGTTAVALNQSKPFTTLILETGTVNNKTSVLATVLASTSKKNKTTTFMNFPISDVLPNNTTISTTYNTGGQAAVIKEIKTLLSLSINKVVHIDIDKLGNVVKDVGGVSIQNPKTFISSGYQFKQGTITLMTSSQVKAYLSEVNANDEIASITRTQAVSMALYKKIQQLATVKNIKSPSYYSHIVASLSNATQTNINFSEFKTILLKYNKSLINITKLNLHATKNQEGEKSISANELARVKTLFEKNLK